MNLGNYHLHTNFSDGSAEPMEYVEAAIQQGMGSIGFSDHSPLPFENTFALREERVADYCASVAGLKKQFNGHTEPGREQPSADNGPASEQLPASSGQIAVLQPFSFSHPPASRSSTPALHHPPDHFRVFLGMEVDYIPGTGYSFDHFRKNYPLDYLIGSVHLVRNGSPDDLWFIDGPDPATYFDGLNNLFGGEIRRGVRAYYSQINEMLESSRMEVIGHFDKIKMHNRGRLFNEEEPWYVALIDETLELVKKHGVIVEVNTRGLYKKRSDSLFPGPAILKKMLGLGIPVVISSDAHKPAEISLLFGETAELLYNIGYREVMQLTPAGWIPRQIRP